MKTSTGLYTKNRRGHNRTREQRVEMGKKGATVLLSKYGVERMQQLGKKGGEAVRDRLGREHFSAIGRKGRRSQLK